MIQSTQAVKTGSFLANVKDVNGTGMLTYIQLLMEKLEAALPHASVTIVIANPIEGTNSGHVEVISNVSPDALPAAIMQLGKDLASHARPVKPTEIN